MIEGTHRHLVLPEDLRRQIEAEGAAAYPNECCGMILGRDMMEHGIKYRLVDRLVAGTNAFEANEQYHRFSIDPRQQLKVEREAEQLGLALLGYYHSHPDHPARPSEYDRQHAWPYYSYVIVAIEKGKAGEMTSWVLDEETEQFQKQAIVHAIDRGGAVLIQTNLTGEPPVPFADEVVPATSQMGEVRNAMNNTSNYVHPEVLVSTGWVAEHANDPKVKVIEVDVDTSSYDKGHVSGAIGWNWQTDLNDKTTRDIIDPRAFAELCRAAGIQPDDTVVFYGDNNNWFAAWALWQFKYHGHKDVRLMNGGRKKWELEGRPLTTEPPRLAPRSNYPIPASDESVRAYRREIEDQLGRGAFNLVDVRSPDEFTGKVIAPPGMTETAQRGGHIPGAKNIPWAKAANDDGTFKSADELRKLYSEAGVDFTKPTIAYCRIGERSSHTWFVLKYLLGANSVKNYDGSWTEWGNLVGAPIEKGEGLAALPNVKCE